MDFPFEMNQQHVLEEDYDENYEPTEEEILEYCKVLNLDPVTERDLMYIAREGIKAPLPNQWKPVEQPGGGIYYFNFATGASTWEHPCDEFYRNLLNQEREKRKRLGTSTAAKTKASNVSGKKKGIKVSSTKQNPTSVLNGMGNGKLHGRGSVDPGGGVVHPAQLMNSTTALATRSNRIGNNLHTSTGGGLSSAAQINLGEPQMGKQQSSPGHGRLAPLSLSGSKPLASISGLPMLKTPHALAPVRIPSAMSQAGSSLGGSLGSTGGSGESTKKSHDPLANSHLRNVELGNIGISNEFEEEDDNEESKSESDLAGGFNKIGMNLIDAEDLGLKETGDSTDDVSKELRKIMDISEASDEDEAIEFLKRPAGHSIGIPPPSPPVGAVAPIGGVNTRGGGNLHVPGEVGVSSPRFTRPTAAKSRDRSDSNKERSDQPSSNTVKSMQQPVSKPAPPSISVSDKAPRTSGMTFAPQVASRADGGGEAQRVAAEHSRTVDKLKESHAQELSKLRHQFAQELEDLKKSLVDQNEVSLDSFRKKLAADQLSEEKRLRAQKEMSLSEMRSRIKEEEADEEARLMEAKQDIIRKLKQQIAIEQEKEERQLKETKEKTLSNLQKQIQDQQSKEESQIRTSSSNDLSKLKERLEQELAEEKRKIQSSHKEELQAIREQADKELKEKKDELNREHQKQREALQSLEKEQQKALEDARAEIERAHNLNDFKTKAMQTHKQAQEETEAELAEELEKKKSALNEQHQAEIATLKEQLAGELEQLRKEENEKVKQERKRFSQELSSSRDALTHEHETTMQQLQTEYETAQNQLKELKQEQLQDIAKLKSDYEAQCEELSKCKCDVEQQLSELEERKRQVETQAAEIKVDEERLEKLRSANAKETEQLLQKQQVELRKDIDKEKKRLNSLKKSCGDVENELQQLTKQRELCLAEIEKLKTDKRDCRSQLSAPQSQAKGQQDNAAAKKAQNTDAKNSSSSARKEEHVKMAPSEPTAPEEGERLHHIASVGASKVLHVNPGHQGDKRDESESEEEEVDMTAGSMHLAELGRSSLKPKISNDFHTSIQQPASDSEDSSALLDNLHMRLSAKSKELHETLKVEQDSLVKTKAFLKEQQETLKQRKRALKLARKDWTKSNKMETTILTTDEGNTSLMRDIRSKLDQEAAALNELEEKMKTNNHLLDRKERAISQLQASLADELEELSDVESEMTPSPPPEMDLNFDIPSPKTYLARLRASLEKSKTYTNSYENHLPSGGLHSRKRNLSSPLPLTAPGLLSNNGLKVSEALTRVGGEDSDMSSASSSSSSISIDIKSGNAIGASLGSKRASQSPDHFRFAPASKVVNGGHVTAWDKKANLLTNGVTAFPGQSSNQAGNGGHNEDSKNIMSSLEMINRQLGELLGRITPQTTTASVPPSAAMSTVPHSQSQYTPSPAHLMVGGVETPALQSPAFASTNAKWADPVPHIDHMELELQRKCQAYLGTPSSLTQTLGNSRFGSGSLNRQPSRPLVSTEALMRTQTDWLKEFRQKVPLSSQLKLSGGVLPPTASSSFTPSHLHGNSTGTGVGATPGEANAKILSPGATLLPSKPRLVLDSSNNVQLVHVSQ